VRRRISLPQFQLTIMRKMHVYHNLAANREETGTCRTPSPTASLTTKQSQGRGRSRCYSVQQEAKRRCIYFLMGIGAVENSFGPMVKKAITSAVTKHGPPPALNCYSIARGGRSNAQNLWVYTITLEPVMIWKSSSCAMNMKKST